MRTLAFVAALAALPVLPVLADEEIADQYPNSVLYSKPVEVIPNVFSAIGATAPPTYENAGHNNNLSFIVTSDQPVKLVFNENGQGHAMLGNSYWAAQGVEIIAHTDAAAEFADYGDRSLQAAQARVKERAAKTTVALPTTTFDDSYEITLGGTQIEARYLGPAHSPGDIVVWLPQQSLVIAGDMAFHKRMLPIFEHTVTGEWIETWDTVFEALNATYVIPGHGHPTNMAQVRRYTRDYLIYLRGKIGDHLEAGGDLAEAYYVDQSPYAHLDTFEELATKNAGRVYEEMEFE